MGAKVGKDCYIGCEVWVDMTNTHLVELQDHVHIANRCLLLCHQRDLSNYCIEDDYAKLGYKKEKIILKRGCLIGMDSMVMPVVTIGEGAIIGAGSLVTKDIPAWTIATYFFLVWFGSTQTRTAQRFAATQTQFNHLGGGLGSPLNTLQARQSVHPNGCRKRGQNGCFV
jgi:UDP-3-O-[3-hydroxymyristoyl] glucosamine N-acyltransferase